MKEVDVPLWHITARVDVVAVSLTPVECHEVVGIVEARLAVKNTAQCVGVTAAEALKRGDVFLPFVPVAAIIAVVACRVGELQAQCLFSRGYDTCGYHVALRMADGLHMVTVTMITEPTVDDAGPEIEGLYDVAHTVRVELKTDGTQVHAVGILAIPVGGPLCPSFLIELRGVEFGMPMTEVKGFQSLFWPVILGIVETVPPPVAHCPERHAIGIQPWKRLQSGSIHGEGKSSVPHGERSERVETGYMGVVASHYLFTVDGLGKRG